MTTAEVLKLKESIQGLQKIVDKYENPEFEIELHIDYYATGSFKPMFQIQIHKENTIIGTDMLPYVDDTQFEKELISLID